MPSIVLLAATARTATIAVEPTLYRYHLPQPFDWRLTFDNGKTASGGVTETIVFTLVDLEPSTGYALTIGDTRFAFMTEAESKLVSISDFGAEPARDDNTAFIQAAIDALPHDATLRIPRGTWLSGPLFLKSHMTLLLEDGAVLSAHSDRSQYPVLPAYDDTGRVLGTWEGVAEQCYASLLTALGCERLTITGAGVVDGGGDRGDWWTWAKETRNGARRPRTIFVSNGRDIRLTGLTVRNSPSWTIHPVLCRNVLMAGLAIENDPDSPNTDGLNPECCRNVTLSGIRFSVGDDCIAIKAGKRAPRGGLDQPCENIRVQNCLMERGHGGVVIGSEMSGSVRDVMISRCVMQRTDRGLRIKTRRGRGGEVRAVCLEDCEMDHVATPIVVNAFYFCDPDGCSDWVQSRAPRPVDEGTPHIAEISVRRLTATNTHIAAAALYGLPEAPIRNVSVKDFAVTYAPDAVAAVPVMACGVNPVRHAGILAENAEFGGVPDFTVLDPCQAEWL
ncbi:polygalacturonase [Ciceribacter lividus]|uniref:Polygalacturonase n=1 Tax=Ciceribacter lividus TaxID=1197950 RepID=A0A6I7HQ71_9HYPH|nr:glycoside hydrolase family 28 protein [Ciceribacter lividus]RCW25848.1 polygalacturonase [Ciceribacter lividus]